MYFALLVNQFRTGQGGCRLVSHRDWKDQRQRILQTEPCSNIRYRSCNPHFRSQNIYVESKTFNADVQVKWFKINAQILIFLFYALLQCIWKVNLWHKNSLSDKLSIKVLVDIKQTPRKCCITSFIFLRFCLPTYHCKFIDHFWKP